jgi:beta-phosphoglucomutase-like phosphatase (HAD superfamily)
MLKLPDGITTCLFDLDGVLTQTAKIHARAWKEMFDGFLRDWAERTGEPFEEFDRPTDYDEYVDGKPRLEGVRSFLESRAIHLDMGSPADPPEAETVHALGTRKNELVLELIRQQGVEPYEGSVRFAEAARDRSLRRAVVSSSTNCEDVLVAAGIDHLFEERIDGVVAEREHLAGKPAPDTSPARGCSAPSPPKRPSSRTRWPAWRRGAPASSAGWSASTAPVRPRRCAAAGQTSSYRTSPSCWSADDRPGRLRGRLVGRAGARAPPRASSPDGVDLRAF